MKHPYSRRKTSNVDFSSRKRQVRIFGTLVLMAGSALLPQQALGSGSYDFPGASAGVNQAYNLGKSVLHKKLLCEGCPLGGTEPDASSARARPPGLR